MNNNKQNENFYNMLKDLYKEGKIDKDISVEKIVDEMQKRLNNIFKDDL